MVAVLTRAAQQSAPPTSPARVRRRYAGGRAGPRPPGAPLARDRNHRSIVEAEKRTGPPPQGCSQCCCDNRSSSVRNRPAGGGEASSGPTHREAQPRPAVTVTASVAVAHRGILRALIQAGCDLRRPYRWREDTLSADSVGQRERAIAGPGKKPDQGAQQPRAHGAGPGCDAAHSTSPLGTANSPRLHRHGGVPGSSRPPLPPSSAPGSPTADRNRLQPCPASQHQRVDHHKQRRHTNRRPKKRDDGGFTRRRQSAQS